MEPRYIIVQAGGKGSRMKSLTRNKPKALVPVDNLPMIFHLFRKYPDKEFIIIGDYKYDVLEKYLKSFADVSYQMVCAAGHTGTCAGLQKALDLVPDKQSLMLIWCDLVLPQEYTFPQENGNYIGISKDFPCRWSYRDGQFIEEKSAEHGVAGHFILQDKSVLKEVPEEGELVRWMQKQGLHFEEQALYNTHEYGLFSEWEELPKLRCRPFNNIEVKDGKLTKSAIDSEGESLAAREVKWYKKVKEYAENDQMINIPDIYEYEPLTMELIDGKNIYEYDNIPYDQKSLILEQIIECLRHVHSAESVSADKDSYYEAYIGKTMDRLEKVRYLVPFANDKAVTINGRQCRNVFYHWEELIEEVNKYLPDKFVLLHGDCTFSNMMLKNDNIPILIDPRGYFGNTELYGDVAYDWAKLYYSLISNYDQFNLKRFNLDIGEESVFLQIESNHWEDMEEKFFELLKGEVTRKQMKLLLAIIWLSLTTYAWEDYDSICGAFYNGLQYLEDALLMSDSGMGDKYFGKTVHIIGNALHDLDMNQFERLIEDAEQTLRGGHKIILSGLGKNVPVCEKFVGTMLSLGLDANFLHTNSAVHGDMGMVRPGDLVIILSKSGGTAESVYLAELLLNRNITLWLLTFCTGSRIEQMIGKENSLVVCMEHEGDPWNIVPNNSTTLNLIILQGLAMTLIQRMGLDLEQDFKPNHPGGKIGEILRYEI